MDLSNHLPPNLEFLCLEYVGGLGEPHDIHGAVVDKFRAMCNQQEVYSEWESQYGWRPNFYPPVNPYTGYIYVEPPYKSRKRRVSYRTIKAKKQCSDSVVQSTTPSARKHC